MNNLSLLVTRINDITSSIKEKLAERLESLNYSTSVINEVLNSSLENLANKFEYIYSNVSKLIKNPISENGMGYSNDEFNEVKSVLFGTTYARQLQALFAETPLNNTNKTVLQLNNNLYYVPTLESNDITDASKLFYNDFMLIACADIKLPNCTNLNYMFYDCNLLQSIQDFEFNRDQPWTASGTFALCSLNINYSKVLSDNKKVKIVTPWTEEREEYWDLSKCIDISHAFEHLGGHDSNMTKDRVIENMYLPDCTNTLRMFYTSSVGNRIKTIGNIYAPKAKYNLFTLWVNADVGHVFFDVTTTSRGLDWSASVNSVKSFSGLCCNIPDFRASSEEVVNNMLDSLYGDIAMDDRLKTYREGHSVIEALSERLRIGDPPTIQFVNASDIYKDTDYDNLVSWIQGEYDYDKLLVITTYWEITEA